MEGGYSTTQTKESYAKIRKKQYISSNKIRVEGNREILHEHPHQRSRQMKAKGNVALENGGFYLP